MAETLAEYRTLVDEILGTAVDSSTWTTTIIDNALRHAVNQYNRLPVYEISFTVTSTAEEQDLSAITDLNEILACAYPWTDGADFVERTQYFRYTDDQTIYFENVEPVAGEKIRTRYTKQHKIEDLDGATSTNIAERHSRLVAVAAASHACTLRYRQLSENPATPPQALDALRIAASKFMDDARDLMTSYRRGISPRWTGIGLE